MKTDTATGFLALAAEALAAVALCVASSTTVAAPKNCTPIAAYEFVGPALSVEDVEALSLKKLNETPYAPQVPFGYQNDQWIAIKSKIQSGDTIHAFRTDVTGGYLLARDKCVVEQITSWIR